MRRMRDGLGGALLVLLTIGLPACGEEASPLASGSGPESETMAPDASPDVEPTEEPRETVRMPRLVGLTLAEARQALRRADLRLETGVYMDPTTFDITSVRRLVSTRPPGTVVRQNIAPRTQVRAGRGVRVVVAAPAPAPGPCDPSYPDVCIAPYPPDLDCPQVGYTNIRVVGSDPHGLDGYDNDGVGCET